MQLRDPALLHIQVPGGSKAVKQFNVGFRYPEPKGALATETAKYLAFLPTHGDQSAKGGKDLRGLDFCCTVSK